MEFLAGLLITDVLFYYVSVAIGIAGTLIAVPIVFITAVVVLIRFSLKEREEYKEKGLPYKFIERMAYKKQQKRIKKEMDNTINDAYNYYLSLSNNSSNALTKYYAAKDVLRIDKSKNESLENIRKLENEAQYCFDAYNRLSDSSNKAFQDYQRLFDLKILSKD